MNPAMDFEETESDIMTAHARYQLWYQYAGTHLLRKCLYPWCQRIMTYENFYVIHYDVIPQWNVSSLDNMRPVCEVCYMNMRRPTMREWVDQMDYEASRSSDAHVATPRDTLTSSHSCSISGNYIMSSDEESVCDNMEL